MDNSNNSIQDRTKKFAVRVIKETQEFIYWCEVFIEAGLVTQNKFGQLLQEADEIARILSSSIFTLKQKLKKTTSNF